MKSKLTRLVLAAMKTSLPISALRPASIRTSCGLKRSAASVRSRAHSPSTLCMASSAGTHPIIPVPVTTTRRAPISYSRCTPCSAALSARYSAKCYGDHYSC